MVKKLVSLSPKNIEYVKAIAKQNRGRQCIKGNFSKELNRIIEEYREQNVE